MTRESATRSVAARQLMHHYRETSQSPRLRWDDLPRTHLSLVSGMVGGRAMKGLRGTSTQGGTITTYVPESGPTLPVEAIEVEHRAHAGTGHARRRSGVIPEHWPRRGCHGLCEVEAVGGLQLRGRR